MTTATHTLEDHNPVVRPNLEPGSLGSGMVRIHKRYNPLQHSFDGVKIVANYGFIARVPEVFR